MTEREPGDSAPATPGVATPPVADPMQRLLAIMAQLRDPVAGCPWDVQQDFSTIAPYTIEEAYEVADAIDRGDMADLKDELGDLLLQVVFHARMAEEAGLIRFEDVAAAKNVDLRIRATPMCLRSDALMLVRILENLVSNAIKFTRGRVLLTAHRHGDEIHVEVRDQGPGIPPDCVDKVFDAFYQGQNTQESARQGVGLGLAIVKRLADALGYRIEVHTRPGRGTLMRLIVPSADLVE